MQHIARTVPPPTILTGSVARQQRDSVFRFMDMSDEKLSQSKVLLSEKNVDDGSMRYALESQFRGRCAFCEAECATEVYRFRPVGEAEPQQRSEFAHLYYNWLDTAWQNFYAICTSCRPQEDRFFPVFGRRAKLPTLELYEKYAREGTGIWPSHPPKEKPYFLDPCIDRDFYKHLDIGTNGVLVGRSERGVATIKHFSLNAPARVKARRDRFKRYFQNLLKWIASSEDAPTPRFFDFPEIEFGGTWYLLLRRVATAIGARTGVRPMLSMGRIDRVFKQLRGTSEAQERLTRCWNQLTKMVPSYQSPVTAGPGKKSPVSGAENRPNDVTLAEVRIENFKSIEQVNIRLENNSPSASRRTTSILIIGENSAGKSSILEAIALALSPPAAREKLGLTARNFILDPRFLGSPDGRDVSHAKVEVVLSNRSTHVLTIEPERMHSHPMDDQANIPVFAYGAFRQYQHKQHRSRSPEAHVRNLFDGSVLLNPEQWLLDLAKDRFAMVVRALRDILSIEGEFEVIRRDVEERQCFVVTATKADGSPLSQSTLNVASSGFRSILAMACDVMRGLMDTRTNPDFKSLQTARGVVLIDEVEAHLHPRWKMRIMRGLRLALPNMTFIATTHDPLCLRGMDDGEVVVLRRVQVEEGTTPMGLSTKLEAQSDLPPISELRVEQLLTSDLFQLHSTDDPEMDRQLAQVGDLLARDAESLTREERGIIERFNRDIASAMPVGTSEAHRLIQEAVVEYLQQRRHTSREQVSAYRAEVKGRIVKALQGV